MASLVSDILTDALNYLGGNSAGEIPSTDDQAFMLRVTNRMLDSWSAKKLSLVTGIQYAPYSLTGAASYLLGPAQTWNNTRPIKIKAAVSIDASGASMPVRVATAEEYGKITDLTRTGVFIEDLFYDDAYPYIRIYVTPKPSAGSIGLYTYEALAQFATWGSSVSLYPGMERALVIVLALELCFAFGRVIPDGLPQAASEAFSTINALFNEIAGGATPPVPMIPAAQGEAT